MSLHAAHKSEAGKPFARVAGAIFALFDRVPGLRSVIAPLRRNPNINPAERIGVNLGDVMVDGSDLYGDVVNIAAGLEGLAEPGGILVSGTAMTMFETK